MSAVRIIKAGDLEIQIREAPKAEANIVGIVPLAEMELRYVRHVLEQCNGNKTHAAKALGISRRALYRMLDQAANTNEVG